MSRGVPHEGVSASAVADPSRRRLDHLVSGLRRRLAAREDAALPARRRMSELLRERSVAPAGEGSFPLSYAQKRLWVLERLEAGSPTYHLPGAVRLRGALDVPAVRAALGEVVRRHAVLRTVFRVGNGGGEPRQIVLPPSAPAVPSIDLSRLSRARREEELRRRGAAEARRPFDFERGPLLRVLVFRLAATDHVLIVDQHHVVSDGWSIGILLRELGSLYDAVRSGRPAAESLPALALQYADFALCQRRWIEEGALAAELAAWRDRLAGVEPVELPADRPPSLRPSSRGEVVRFAVSAALTERLRELARRGGTTLFTVLLTAFKVLLHRGARQDDVTVGVASAGRAWTEVEDLIGFFVNSLAVRTDLGGDPSFAESVGRVAARALEAQRLEDVPFDLLVETLHPTRETAATPFFQTMLSFETARPPLRLGELAAERLDLETGTAKFDLTVMLEEVGQGLAGALEARADRFDRTTGRRLVRRFTSLLESAVAGPERRLGELELLPAAERHQLVHAWSGEVRGGLRRPTVTELFAARASQHPERVAVSSAGGTLTYGELRARALRRATSLRRLGVGPEVRVGLCVGRAPGMVVATLAILEAGGAYVPLDPEYPQRRLAFMVKDAGVAVIVAEASLRSRLPEPPPGVTVVELDGEDSGAAAPVGRVEPGSLAYVMYTSGSTGLPKGVAATHRGVVRLVQGTGFVPLGPSTVFLQLAPISFDASTLEIWGPLLNGGRLALFRPGPFSVRELGKAVARHRVTTLWLTAGLFHQAAEEDAGAFRPLRHLLSGGDVLSPVQVQRVLESSPGLLLVNGYGPTENTTFTTCHGMRRAPPGPSVAIGRPITGTRIVLVDRAGRPVPAGAAGELVTGGEGLARGYLGRAGLTAERFVPDAVFGDPGERLYRTGDRARFRGDGTVEFLGRLDDQVKIRGFRVELGEVESVLAKLDGVRQAAVVVERRSGEARLVAYASGALDPATVRRSLAERLPAHLVPSAFLVMEELPLGATGKVDRGALPSPDVRAVVDEAVSPRTPTEEVLAAIWSDLLETGEIGVEDDFFALGGHSLLATRVVSRVLRDLGVTLELRELFERPTIAALAERVDASRRAERPAPPPLAAGDGEPVLSFAQERLWFLDRLEPGSAAYNVPAAARLAGRLEVAALAAGTDLVEARHETLRTTFAEVDGRPRPRLAPPVRRPLPVVDLSGLGASVAGEGRRVLAREAARPFDLAAGPLWRRVLLRLAPAEHVLFVGLHHVVTDGWSMGVLIRDVAVAYDAARRSVAPAWPALPVRYADYARWQRSWLRGEALAELVGFWRARLAEAPFVLELPADRVRPAVASARGARVEVEWPASLAEALEALARRRGATLFMALLAGLDALLARLTGASDLVVGTAVAHRTRLEVEDLVGFFVNSLALRVDAGGDPPFGELVDRARESALAAYDHQDLPFEKLVEELAPERHLSATPVFQLLLVLQNAPRGPLGLGEIEVTPFDLHPGAAKLDLSLTLERGPAGIRGVGTYRRDLFEATTMRRFVTHLGRLLTSAAADPGRRLSALELLGAAERHQLLVSWNVSPRLAAAAATVLELFEERARRTPAAVAVVFEQEALSYGELDRRAGALAAVLRRAGVGSEVTVGLERERGTGMIEAIVAVHKAGGAYTAVDAAAPPSRRRWQLADAGAAVLLGADGGLERLRQLPARAGGAGTAGLAYVSYTSGSTGRPKGVAVEHRQLLAYVLGLIERLELGAPRRFATVSTLAADLGNTSIYGALATGGTLHVVSEERLGVADAFAAYGERIDVLKIVPSHLAALLDAARPAGVLPRECLILGGEACDGALLRRIRSLDPSCRIFNHYGPTETTVGVAVFAVPRSSAARSPIPLGRPLAGARIHLADRRGSTVPIGVAGELLVAGEQVARGYLRRPARTAAVFRPDPFGAPGGRLYRTGDLGRRRGDGAIELLGRIDHQMKVRGFRIEPGEIEAALVAHPAVRDAVVLAVRDAAGETRLAAYVVARGVTAHELRAHVAARLPGVMVPSAVLLLERLPLTANGKVDRRALPPPEGFGGEPSAEPVRPRNAVEERVAGLWAEVLGVEAVGVETSFFELGGHSLLATRLLSRLRAAFGVELELRALFEAPTVAALAARLETARRVPLPPIAPAARRGETAPLSFAQERLWFLRQLAPEDASYHLPYFADVRGRFDAGAFAAALAAAERRHESLRTVFERRGGAPFQRVLAPGRVRLLRVDLRALPAERRDAEAETLARHEARRRFDLERGPLLRAVLIRRGAEDHRLLLALHHLICDAWSRGLLVRELLTLYRAAVERWTPVLPVPRIRYADFALWQRASLVGETLEALLAPALRRLAGAPVVELPFDHPRRPRRTRPAAQAPIALPPAETAALRRLARRHGATLFTTLLAVFDAWLCRVTGQVDLVVGSPVANRNRLETEGVVGLFVNTLALRVDTAGDPSLGDLLARAREAALDAQAAQDLPFERLVEALRPERETGANPLVQVVLVLQDVPAAPPAVPGLLFEPLRAAGGDAKLDLVLAFEETVGGGLAGVVEVDRGLFEEVTLRRFRDQLRRFLAAAAPERRLSDLPLLSAAERHQLVHAWGGGVGAAPDVATVAACFAARAAEHPERVAVDAGGGTLTYGALGARSRRRAAELRRLGVGPEARVGLCAGRTPGMVEATLAILEAGGAYVPLDPEYPAERLALMVEDAGLTVILTEAALRPRLPASLPGVRIVELEGEPAPAAAAPVPCGGRRSLAYVMYTSGSTGRPKGVAATHGGILRLVRGSDFLPLGPETTFLQLAPIAFDASTLEIWGPLLNGGRLVLFRPGPFSARELGEALARHRITSLWLTAGLFHQAAEEDAGVFRPLRHLLSGGDALSPVHARRALEAAPGLLLVNGYGPTENTTFTTCHGTRRAPSGPSVAIGRPIAGTRIALVDRAGRSVPSGAAGELVTGGEGLARGYLGRPGLTAERFVPDAVVGDPGERLYRTGDRARFQGDGTVEFLGRLDDQVKVRGFRVEPGEVTAVLSELAGVRQAAVVVERRAGEARLVAYVAGPAARPRELRRRLAARLPDHLVPSAWVVLDELPLGPTGKVDRGALPAPDARAAVDAAVSPRTPTEEVLAAIWSDLLETGEVGVEDDFFALGGHSLLATRVVSRVLRDLGVTLELRELFEQPTITALAERVQASRRSGVPPPPPLAASAGPAVLSFAQERLWFLDRLEPGSAAYNVSAAARLTGRLDVAVLAAGLELVETRHETLRTRFAEVDGRPEPRIGRPVRRCPPLVDVSGLGAAAAGEGRRRLEREAARPFDLAAGPLWRPLLVRLGREEHVLLLVLHHVVTDGWSMGILIREVAAAYEAVGRSAPPSWPALAVRYTDYARWQRGWLRGEALARLVAFWRQRLAGAPPVLELPADRPRRTGGSGRGASVAVCWPSSLAEAVEGTARRRGATLFMGLLAGLQGLVRKLTGTDDVVVGTAVANRSRVEVEGLVGFFVNSLALRVDLGGDPSFAELLDRVRRCALEAYDHQDLPFEKLVEEVRPERHLSSTPIFQVLLVLQNVPRAPLELGDLAVEPVEIHPGAAKLDLSLTLERSRAGIVGAATYRRDLFDETTVRRFLGHLERLVGSAAGDTDRRLSAVEILSAAERHQLLVSWNASPRAAAPAPVLLELLAEQVRRRPEAAAVVFEEKTLSYGELDRRSGVLAGVLREAGVGPEVAVGLDLGRGVETIVAIVAVHEAGGAYTALDPGAPAARRRFQLADSGAAVLLGDGGRLERLRRLAPRAVDGDPGPAERLAYVSFTSGSTGRPKGVAVTHGQLAAYVAGLVERLGLDRPLRFATVSTPAADLGNTSIYGSLATGGTLHVVSDERAVDADAFAAYGERAGIDVLKIVPSHLAALLAAERPKGALPRELLILGGEACDGALVRRIRSLDPRCRIVNHYGPTEATIGVATFALSRGSEVPNPIPVGRPLSGARIVLVDRRGAPVPIGAAGELLAGGGQVARGYLGRPAQTAAAFRPDPFAAGPGGRLYGTGDLARRRRDGAVELLGRIDGQVKVRGFRVEPGEVEAVLGEHPAVSAAAVVAFRAPETRLAAYAVVSGASAGELREHLAARLPAAMVPSSIVLLERLPLTPNGKVDRRALPRPEAPSAERGTGRPLGGAEELVAELCAEVLGVETVDVGASFFDLGGHSLLATRLLSRLRSAFAVELDLRALFEAPTIAALAARLETARRPSLPPVVPAAKRGETAPLSFSQERLWFLQQLVPEDTSYHLPYFADVRGALDAGALAAALAAAERRHESLRTVFERRGGAPVQRVLAPGRASVLRVELGGLPAHVVAAEREALTRREARRRFDLERGPLLRAAIVRRGAEDHRLLLGLHHLVCDAWSRELLVGEISELYRAAVERRPVALAAPRLQYADFALWQRAALAGETLEALLTPARERLAGSPPVELPVDRARRARRTRPAAQVPIDLAPAAVAALRRAARRRGATLFMALLAAFDAWLCRVTGQSDLVVGSPVANRNRLETEGVIGFFVNTLALRVEAAGDPTFGALLTRAREAVLEAQAGQDLPFERLVEALRPSRDTGTTPLVQVVLVLQEASAAPPAVPGLAFEPLRATPGDAKFDLTLGFEPTADGGLVGALEGDRSLFEQVTLRRFREQLRRFLGAAAPERRLSELPLLSAAERHEATVEARRRARAASALPPIHRLVAARAAERPEAAAVCQGERRLTYGELERRANRLARLLRSRGVGPEARVALLLERTPRLVVAILAVLKTGGAYIPLDPSNPAERLAYVLADAGAAAVLCESSLAERLEEAGVEGPALLVLDRLESELAAGPDTPPDDGLDGLGAASLAYVIYTSGSTGRPKGVGVTHANVARLFRESEGLFGFGPDDVWTLFHSPAFDFSVWEIWGALFHGGRLVVVPYLVSRSPRDFAELVARERATIVSQTASAFRPLTAAGLAERRDLALRAVVFGGEALDVGQLAPWLERPAAPRMVNMYGITETTVHVTYRAVSREDLSRPGSSPIGRGLDDLELFVVDRHLDPVPRGVAGELRVGGAGLARGYLGRPGLTASRFTPHAWSDAPGERLYGSGDLARVPPDGGLEYLGRIDAQVKLRGFRIELGEIEAALARHRSVRRAAVLLVGDGHEESRLVAFVAARGEVPAAELRAHAAQALPEVMVPSAFVPLDDLPLTVNGKLDRRALLRLAAERPELAARAESAYVAPRTAAERTIAEIWCEALGVSRVGVDDNFFDLGGHSLLMARIQTRLDEAFARPVPMLLLFEHPTVGALAARLEAPDKAPEPTTPVLSQSRDRAAERHARTRRQKARRKGRERT